MSLIRPDDTWLLVALMVAGTTLAIWLEQRHRWGSRLSAPVIALLIAMALSNGRIIPMEAPAYDFVGTWLVPIALPLLLFRANLFHIFGSTGRMMVAFHVATVGTLLGAVAAFGVLRAHIPDPVDAAAIMTGSYIGGMVNFTALSESLGARGSLTSALIVADNLVMAGMFLVLLWLAGNRHVQRWFNHDATAASAESRVTATESAASTHAAPAPLLDVALALAVAVGVAGVALTAQKHLAQWFPVTAGEAWWEVMGKTLVCNRFVLVTAGSLVVSTVFSNALAKVRGAEPLGAYLLYLYLFTVGLPADLRGVLMASPMLFVFCSVMAVVNLGFTLVVGRFLRLPLEELLLSVNATLGGPPTAAAMAMSKGWSQRVLPALLAGIWGYVIGTPLGLVVAALVGR
ncbi:MAG: DUF819 domain-containing protein [Verrucomicrobiales bacterium]